METIFDFIVYLTVNTVNNKIYIGIHKTANYLEFDGYIGNDVYVTQPSSYNNPKTVFLRAVKKHGPKAFKRTVIKVFKNRQDALDLERWLVDEQFVKRIDTYNMVLGGAERPPTNRLKVYMYDKKGNFVKEFNSRTDASLFVYGNLKNAGNITRAIKSGYFCKDYQFSNCKYEFMKDYSSFKTLQKLKLVETFKNKTGLENRFGNPKPVEQYDLEGNLIKVYESLGLCKKAGFTNAQAVIEGKRSKCKGYYFKYKD